MMIQTIYHLAMLNVVPTCIFLKILQAFEFSNINENFIYTVQEKNVQVDYRAIRGFHIRVPC